MRSCSSQVCIDSTKFYNGEVLVKSYMKHSVPSKAKLLLTLSVRGWVTICYISKLYSFEGPVTCKYLTVVTGNGPKLTQYPLVY